MSEFFLVNGEKETERTYSGTREILTDFFLAEELHQPAFISKVQMRKISAAFYRT